MNKTERVEILTGKMAGTQATVIETITAINGKQYHLLQIDGRPAYKIYKYAVASVKAV